MTDNPSTKPTSESQPAKRMNPESRLHRLFEIQAGHRPDAIALVCDENSVTYDELNRRANQIAHALITAGVNQDAPVGLCMDRSTDMVAGLLGIMKAGGAYVPLDPAYPPERLAHILDQADPALIVSKSELHKFLPADAGSFVDIDALVDESDVNPDVDVQPDQLCYLIFTSGSTGTPKGVMVTHRNVARLFDTLSGQIDFRQTDTWTLFHSYAFGYSAWELFGSLLHGAKLVIVPEEARTDPQALYNLLKRQEVTVFSQTPSAFRQLLLDECFARSNDELSLRLIVFSGEAVVKADLQAWYRRHGDSGPQLINTYAITETGGQVALRTYAGTTIDADKSRNIGLPLADTQVLILDANLLPVANGETGELCVGGPGLSRGYINQPELTAEKFLDVELPGQGIVRIYRTGDQARILANGEIEFLGRTDNQVKVRGYRVEPGDIEACLATHPDIREAAVVLRSDGGGDARLVAYLVSGKTQPSVSAIRSHLEQSLPDYMVPALFVYMDQLPLNPSGKLDRKALPAPGNARPELGVPYAAPENKLQQRLATVWAAVLGTTPIGIHDNFFELGGDSILALKLTSQLRQLLGEYFYISALIDAPTIAELARTIEADFPASVAALGKPGNAPSGGEELPAVVPDHANRHEIFPLTDIQQAYLVGRGTDFSMGNVSTHLYIEVDALNLDLPRLERAWQKVIDRHAMLRAIVLPDGVQRILPDVPPYRFHVQDLQNSDAAAVESGLTHERERLSHQVIPSDRWPLFELSATLLPAGKTRIHISLDCLITDARSFQIMSGELLTYYHDEDAQLPLPGLSFRDYVLAENRLREGDFYKRALDYWKQRIETLPGMPQLPLARAPETLEEHRFTQRGYELSRSDWEKFQARASQAGITPTAALLQCFGETLAAWSRSPRLTLNLTLFNRMPLHPDVDDVVGDFTSLVLLGIDKLDEGSFENRAQHLQKELWRGVDNRFVSGVRVLREIAQMGERIQPMMPVVFTSTLGIGSGGQDSSSWHHLGEQVFSVSQTPQVWIDHVASERDGALWCTWDVVDALFPAGMIDDLFAAYTNRLTQLARSESSWQQEWTDVLDNILPAEQKRQRHAANATDASIPSHLLHEGFVARAAASPEATAIISNDRVLSYGKLDRLSNQLARELQNQGVGTNELVAVVMQKGWEQIVAVLGILKAGAAYLPVDASMPAERLHYLLDFGKARIAVTQTCQDAAIDWPVDTVRIRISDSNLAELDASPVVNPAELDDIAYVIFTSGSTGQPKGVVIDHRGAVNTCDDINQRFAAGAGDRVLALSSLSFDLSVYDIFGLLSAGGAVVVPDAAGMRDPAHWAEMVAKHRVSIWNTVPALMDLLADYAEQQVQPVLQSLRVVMMSGDWIPVKLPERIRAVGQDVSVYSLGGATEASIWSIIYPIETVPKDWVSIPYGKPLLNQTFHVLNDALAPCPVWVPGELYIGGIGLAKGYWRDAQKTAASFITHPRTGERLYRTGDLGRYLPDGNIEFMGREDFQVKIQGFRVELGDIEAALEAHSRVRNAVVIAHGPDRGAKRLVAYVVGEGTAPTADDLRTWLSDKLPQYMVPATYVILDKLPLTANGKIDRRELPEPPTPDQAVGLVSASVQVQADSVNEIASIVAKILGVDELDPNANLLQMGATSIEMIRIANALDQALGFRPRMDEFYRTPSINGLGALFSKNKPATAQSEAMGGDPLQTPAWLLTSIEKIMDPDDRAAFKASRPGLRRFAENEETVALASAMAPETEYLRHRSYRDFATGQLSANNFSELLACLRSRQLADHPKYLYASAGGLYPVQCYLYIKPDRIEGIDGGGYYYDPDAHRLVKLSDGNANVRDIYDPLINRPIFDKSAFALYLVAELAAIGAMYRERALHYATLEAGHMTQLLEMRAPDSGIGLCQIGGLETADLAEILPLQPTHLALHGLLGGRLPDPQQEAVARNSGTTDIVDERDEGEL